MTRIGMLVLGTVVLAGCREDDVDAYGNFEATEVTVAAEVGGRLLAFTLEDGDRLKKGALPLEQVLRFGVEIADALDKAHRQGIVHRDLKPGNVMLTKSGAKLLDFGLAKLRAPDLPVSAASELSALPTGDKALTAEGSLVGTFQYMAPEQLEGKDADARTDIFAFGAVLYEMATGRKAFSGASQASLISAIMKEEPKPIASVEPASPAASTACRNLSRAPAALPARVTKSVSPRIVGPGLSTAVTAQ